MTRGVPDRATLPTWLHAPHGRPFLFVMQREWAVERGHRHLLKEIDRASELWERAPEEWELQRVEPNYFGPVRWSVAVLEALAPSDVARWPCVGGQRINPAAILRLRSSWPDVVRFFGALQIDVAWRPDRLEYELRPTSETLARNNAAHFPTYDPLPRGHRPVVG